METFKKRQKERARWETKQKKAERRQERRKEKAERSDRTNESNSANPPVGDSTNETSGA